MEVKHVKTLLGIGMQVIQSDLLQLPGMCQCSLRMPEMWWCLLQQRWQEQAGLQGEQAKRTAITSSTAQTLILQSVWLPVQAKWRLHCHLCWTIQTWQAFWKLFSWWLWWKLFWNTKWMSRLQPSAVLFSRRNPKTSFWYETNRRWVFLKVSLFKLTIHLLLDKTTRNCDYKCDPSGTKGDRKCTVRYIGPNRPGQTSGSCFPGSFGGGCSGTPRECQDCNKAIFCWW